MTELQELQKLTELLVNTENALKESESRFQIVVENIPDIVYVIDNEGIIEDIYGNIKQYDYSYEDLIGKPFSVFIHPGDFEAVINNCNDSYHGNNVSGVSEFRFRTKKGIYRWVRTHYKLYNSKEIGVCTDITYAKELVNALQRSEDKYKRIVEDQTELICRFLPDGLITFTNNAFNVFFDIPKKQIIGKNYFDLLDEDSKKEVNYKLSLVSKDLPVISSRVKIINNTDEIYLNVNFRKIFDELGEALIIQAVCRDITEQVKLENILYKRCFLLETVSNNIDAMMWTKDSDGRYTFASKLLASRILSCEPEDALGFTDYELIKKYKSSTPSINLHGDINGVSDLIVKKEKKSCRFYEVIIEDDVEIWLDVKKSLLKDFSGNTIGIVGVAFDITHDKNDIKKGLDKRIKDNKIKEIIPRYLYLLNQ